MEREELDRIIEEKVILPDYPILKRYLYDTLTRLSSLKRGADVLRTLDPEEPVFIGYDLEGDDANGYHTFNHCVYLCGFGGKQIENFDEEGRQEAHEINDVGTLHHELIHELQVQKRISSYNVITKRGRYALDRFQELETRFKDLLLFEDMVKAGMVSDYPKSTSDLLNRRRIDYLYYNKIKQEEAAKLPVTHPDLVGAEAQAVILSNAKKRIVLDMISYSKKDFELIDVYSEDKDHPSDKKSPEVEVFDDVIRGIKEKETGRLDDLNNKVLQHLDIFFFDNKVDWNDFYKQQADRSAVGSGTQLFSSYLGTVEDTVLKNARPEREVFEDFTAIMQAEGVPLNANDYLNIFRRSNEMEKYPPVSFKEEVDADGTRHAVTFEGDIPRVDIAYDGDHKMFESYFGDEGRSASILFRDGQPYQMISHDRRDVSFYEIRNGKRNSVPFKEVEYDENGKLFYEMIYENDMPKTRRLFHNGSLDYLTEFNGLDFSTYNVDENEQKFGPPVFRGQIDEYGNIVYQTEYDNDVPVSKRFSGQGIDVEIRYSDGKPESYTEYDMEGKESIYAVDENEGRGLLLFVREADPEVSEIIYEKDFENGLIKEMRTYKNGSLMLVTDYEGDHFAAYPVDENGYKSDLPKFKGQLASDGTVDYQTEYNDDMPASKRFFDGYVHAEIRYGEGKPERYVEYSFDPKYNEIEKHFQTNENEEKGDFFLLREIYPEQTREVSYEDGKEKEQRIYKDGKLMNVTEYDGSDRLVYHIDAYGNKLPYPRFIWREGKEDVPGYFMEFNNGIPVVKRFNDDSGMRQEIRYTDGKPTVYVDFDAEGNETHYQTDEREQKGSLLPTCRKDARTDELSVRDKILDKMGLRESAKEGGISKPSATPNDLKRDNRLTH